MRGDQQIVRADRLSDFFNLRAQVRVMSIDALREGQYFDVGEQLFDFLGQGYGAFFCRAITHFAGDDDTGANAVFTLVLNAARHRASRLPDQIRESIGVEKIAQCFHL